MRLLRMYTGLRHETGLVGSLKLGYHVFMTFSLCAHLALFNSTTGTLQGLFPRVRFFYQVIRNLYRFFLSMPPSQSARPTIPRWYGRKPPRQRREP